MDSKTRASSLVAGAAAAALLGMVGALAFAADTIPVGPDAEADARAVQEGLFGISLGILMPCVQKHMDAGEAADVAEGACFCEHRGDIDARLVPIRQVLARRPAWKGKVLEIRAGDETLHLELENVDRIETKIASCPGPS